MRFILLMLVGVLASCAAAPVGDAARAPVNGLGQAQAYCLGKGYVRGGYEYDSCYRNRPEVQAHERAARLTSMQILAQNKSYSVARGRSYPVE